MFALSFPCRLPHAVARFRPTSLHSLLFLVGHLLSLIVWDLPFSFLALVPFYYSYSYSSSLFVLIMLFHNFFLLGLASIAQAKVQYLVGQEDRSRMT